MDETPSPARPSHAVTTGGAGLSKQGLLAVVGGNWLEFYDFLTFSFFATQISAVMFPGRTEADRLLLTLATFGAGFLSRPLGGLVLGRMADRVGRRPAMTLSFVLMGVAILGLALTPSFAMIGWAAPVLVLAFRLVQGFALGGDVGAATAYMIESAPPHRRGLYASLQAATCDFAVLCAGLVGVALSRLLSPDALNAYGWRIALLLGAVIVPVGVALRRRLSETLPDPADRGPGESFRPYLPLALMGLVLLGGGTIVSYTLDYMTTYAGATLHMPSTSAFGVTAVVGASLVVADLASGWLSDRFGRKPVMMIGTAVMLVLTLPAFILLTQTRSTAVLFGASGLLSVVAGIGAGPVLIAVTEALPQRVRAGSLALIYALSISVFGGSTQFMVTWLLKITREPLVPAYYMTAAVGVSLLVMLLLPETAPLLHRRGRARVSSASAASQPSPG
jgi:MFS family permease